MRVACGFFAKDGDAITSAGELELAIGEGSEGAALALALPCGRACGTASCTAGGSLRGCGCRGLPAGDEPTDAAGDPLGDGAVDAAAELAALDCAEPWPRPWADRAGSGWMRRLGAMSDVDATLLTMKPAPPRSLPLLLLTLRRRTGVA